MGIPIPIPMHTCSLLLRAAGQHARRQSLGAAQQATGRAAGGAVAGAIPSARWPLCQSTTAKPRRRSADSTSGVVARRPARLPVAVSLERLTTVAWRCHASWPAAENKPDLNELVTVSIRYTFAAGK